MNAPLGTVSRLAGSVLAFVLFVASSQLAAAVSCPVASPVPDTDAGKALLSAHYSDAESLYRKALAAKPGDARLNSGLVHALLHEEKIQEAADVVHAALAASPGSAALLTLRGEVELRQGVPWDATKTATETEQLDPCNPRTKLLLAELARINSLYAAAQNFIRMAHQLDPYDPEIRGEWLMTLPLNQRIPELESFLQQPTGHDEEEVRHMHLTLDRWKKLREQPHKPCRLVSDLAATEVPMARLMYDPDHQRSYGLDVKLNNHDARLEIDTGAGGLLVTRAVAQRAGLAAFSQNEVTGAGDHGDKPGYTAYVDSIRIGNLEFQNCAVEVLDSRHSILDSDGLIGMDVLSHFLVTLDFPMRKLLLSPLPPRPGDSAAAKPELKTADSSPEDDQDDDAQAQESSAAVSASGQKASQQNPSHGPWDRYIAPEMKDYQKVYRVGHDLILPAALSGSKPRLFILDTGAWTTVVSQQAAGEVTKVHKSDLEVRGLSGKVEKVYTANEITFRFANLSQKATEVPAFDMSKFSKDAGMEITGLLGAKTLNLLTIHIDYRDGLVKFEYDPDRGYHNPNP